MGKAGGSFQLSHFTTSLFLRHNQNSSDDERRRATWLELFYDLVFVAAIAFGETFCRSQTSFFSV
jgi:hypothetical protein